MALSSSRSMNGRRPELSPYDDHEGENLRRMQGERPPVMSRRQLQKLQQLYLGNAAASTTIAETMEACRSQVTV
jgi:hypothetical protein